ncbi:hypothetical protein [Dactylosporangium cerinum]
MLSLLIRRAGAQWPLLAALLGVVTVGATLLGTCALLTTRTAERAYEVAAARAAPDTVDVTAYTGTIEGPHAGAVAGDARDVIAGALAPFPTTTHTRASSILRALPAAVAAGTTVAPQTYLTAMDDLPARAQLTAGRWPQAAKAPLEAVLLEQTAQLLGVGPGSRLQLGAELAHAAVPRSTSPSSVSSARCPAPAGTATRSPRPAPPWATSTAASVNPSTCTARSSSTSPTCSPPAPPSTGCRSPRTRTCRVPPAAPSTPPPSPSVPRTAASPVPSATASGWNGSTLPCR